MRKYDKRELRSYMYPEIKKNKKLKKNDNDSSKYSKNCKVSIASNEIMLHRFSNGKDVEFPFKNY